MILRLGMIAYDILSFDKSLRSFSLFSRKSILNKEPGLNTQDLSGGCAYSDAQVVYSERLCYEIMLAAQRAGAEVLTHTKAVDLKIEADKVSAIQIKDELTGKTVDVKTSVVINTAGPWIDQVWPKESVSLPRMNGGTKGTHFVLKPFPGAPKDAFYYESRKDGRPMMVIPWKDRYLIGSTDIPFEGDLDTVSATQDEYDYILNETNMVLPGANIKKEDIIYAYTGVRPLPYKKGAEVSDITRRHIIVDHKKDHYDGLFTLVGGKLTTFRKVGEDFGDMLCKRFGKSKKSGTLKLKFPGAENFTSLQDIKARILATDIDEKIAERFTTQYGMLGVAIAEFILSTPERQTIIDKDFALTVGEVEWAVTNEDAYRLSDVVARRVMTGLEDDLGLKSLEAVSKVCASVLGWNEEQRQYEIDNYKTYIQRLIVK